jgi:cytoskeletal protein RodZ
MPTVGEQLRKAREARNLRVQEVAEATKMRSDHILALEEGNYAPFPAPVYVRGSVRTYAKLLQLDVMQIMDALAAELETGGETKEAGPNRLPRRGVVEFLAYHMARFGWKRSVAALAAVVVLLILLLIRLARPEDSAADPMADIPPPRYEPTSTEGGYLPLPDSDP